MFKNNRAFTFVELIIVVTIMALLATIGFVVYKDYLLTGYDTNRMQQLSDIKGGLELYSINSRLPLPDNMMDVTVSGSIVAYQGDAGDVVINTIGYDGGGLDAEFDTPFVYLADKKGKDFQLMGFVSDKNYLSQISSTYADSIQYADYYPKVVGSPLGILLDHTTLEPLHLSGSLSGGSFDIGSPTSPVRAYLSDDNYLSSIKGELTQVLPDFSCKRILELGKSQGNREYILSISGKRQKVYCDMETDGGGWSFAGYLDSSSTGSSISFNNAMGDYSSSMSSTQGSYSLKMDDLRHKEMMILIGEQNPAAANSQGRMIMYKYQVGMPGFYTGPINCSTFLDNADGFFYKMYFEDDYRWTRHAACTSNDWSTRPNPVNYPTTPDTGNKYNMRFTDSLSGAGGKGAGWWPSAWGLSGSPSWGNSAWIFVR